MSFQLIFKNQIYILPCFHHLFLHYYYFFILISCQINFKERSIYQDRRFYIKYKDYTIEYIDKYMLMLINIKKL